VYNHVDAIATSGANLTTHDDLGDWPAKHGGGSSRVSFHEHG
jgi:hypothetical protein